MTFLCHWISILFNTSQHCIISQINTGKKKRRNVSISARAVLHFVAVNTGRVLVKSRAVIRCAQCIQPTGRPSSLVSRAAVSGYTPDIGGTKQFWRRNRLKETATTNCVCKWVNGESRSPVGLTTPGRRRRPTEGRKGGPTDGRAFRAKTDRFSAIVAYGDRSVAVSSRPLTLAARPTDEASASISVCSLYSHSHAGRHLLRLYITCNDDRRNLRYMHIQIHSL